MANGKAQKSQVSSMVDYANDQLQGVGVGKATKRKRTRKVKCNAADVHKILAHEAEWCNKTPDWIAKKVGRSKASVRTIISSLRQEGYYPKTLGEVARSIAKKYRHGNDLPPT